LDAITQRWYSIETYLEEHVSSNGKYNLAIDKYVLQHAEQLDAIAELPLPCQKTRAKSILPLDLLNKAPRKQLARLFLKEVSPLEWINESLGLKTQKEGILFIHNDRLNDPDYLIKKHKALNEQLKTLEHEYIIGSQEVTLLAISKLLYSLRYIEERMHQCAKEGMKNNVLSSEKKRLSTPFISNFFTRNKAPNHLPSAEKQTRKSHRRAASI